MIANVSPFFKSKFTAFTASNEPSEVSNETERLFTFNNDLFDGNNLVKLDSNYLNWIETNITNDDLNVRALMARTNRILKLSECNAYEAPFPDKSYKLALKKLPSIFPVSKETEGYEISLKAEEWWKQNITTKCMLIGSAKASCANLLADSPNISSGDDSLIILAALSV